MKKRDPNAPHSPAADLGISRRALAIARLLDRHCRAPGRYTITIEIPAHARAPWSAEITRVEPIRRLQLTRPPADE
ncbi:MAG: hypothetical protein L0332_29950 [Chloroflexi bacterium]|nr:hypothetical protein [Chloroflexota bacterium]MCI0580391.1 hypothetical protein [Chloroflexota bacterium]MCI0648640.1 hypothetical protein [Chloroflexota bacterium]MCI0730925.1 hypothetical protein [Chloroflexota bacterium]